MNSYADSIVYSRPLLQSMIQHFDFLFLTRYTTDTHIKVVRAAITTAFEWRTTPEGYEYWAEYARPNLNYSRIKHQKDIVSMTKILLLGGQYTTEPWRIDHEEHAMNVVKDIENLVEGHYGPQDTGRRTSKVPYRQF